VDDHPLIIEAYTKAFDFISNKNKMLSFSIDYANTCDIAEDKIKRIVANKKMLDMAFLDIRLPFSKNAKAISGEDIGITIKKTFPDSKIIISTSLNNNYRIHSLLQSINPDGFLIKGDICSDEIVKAIETVITNPPYYSQTVLKLLRKELSNDFLLDKIDRRILFELSNGSKMKDLPKIVFLSIAGIEKRKRHLKYIFDVEDKGDRELFEEARKKGFI
jgi:DNA-binding NarL/FixJ family response regulator